jgi:clan AA aspartic protease
LTLLGRRPYSISVVVDTGFGGYLLLSARYRKKLELTPVAFDRYELADGRVKRVRVYLSRVLFGGKDMPVLVALTGSEDSLIGASLLKRRRLSISYPARTVTIR